MEIGAGLGALTLPLSGSVSRIVAIEKDPLLTDELRKRLSLAGIKNVDLINGDILKIDFAQIPLKPPNKIKIIGNLPYNISSPFLEKLTQNRDIVSRAVLMFQFEFARRLTAAPGGKEYGAMSILVQYHARASALIEVAREAFSPRPKVASMVVELDFERPYPKRAENEDLLKSVVKGAFAYRRKTLLNTLNRALFSLGAHEILTVLHKCGIDPKRRAETLDMDDFLCLTSRIASLP
jgi:16S rRNA (adenine1518-N6/adenine1519-N6)-dimethyltransferase